MKVAIVTTLKDSEPYLTDYINYHLAAGFDRIFLFFDNPEDTSIAKNLKREEVIIVKNDDELHRRWESTPNYRCHKNYIKTDLIARQILNMNVALKMALDLDIAWLLHIDTDELFYYPDGSIKEHFNYLESENIHSVKYFNHEAIPEKTDISVFFREVTLFKKNIASLSSQQHKIIKQSTVEGRQYFNFYDNGKPAVRVSKEAIAKGPHFFGFRKTWLQYLFPWYKNKRSAYLGMPFILHYPCCGFEYFLRKYNTIGDFPDKWLGRIAIKENLPVHISSRDICKIKDMESALIFYKAQFVETPFADRDTFIKAGICFDIHLGSDKSGNITPPFITNPEFLHF